MRNNFVAGRTSHFSVDSLSSSALQLHTSCFSTGLPQTVKKTFFGPNFCKYATSIFRRGVIFSYISIFLEKFEDVQKWEALVSA